MHLSTENLPIKLAAPGAVVRQQPDFGDAGPYQTLGGEHLALAAGTDMAPLLQGLTDDLCHAPHWGYLLAGRLSVTYAEQPAETCTAGEIFFWPAGHSVRVDEDAEIVMFSPAHEHTEVLDHMLDTMAASAP